LIIQDDIKLLEQAGGKVQQSTVILALEKSVRQDNHVPVASGQVRHRDPGVVG
jgi:hypothetical protein